METWHQAFNDGGLNAANFATHLVERLSRSGVDFFLDHRSLKPGDDWSDKIMDHAERSQVMVVVLSPTYFLRYWCMHELDLAMRAKDQGAGITIVPVYYGIEDLGGLIKAQREKRDRDRLSITQDEQCRSPDRSQPTWREVWQEFGSRRGVQGADADRWVANLEWLDKHAQAARLTKAGKNSESELEQEVASRVYALIPQLLHNGFTVSLEENSNTVQELLSSKPVVAIVGAGKPMLPLMLHTAHDC